MLGFPSAPVPEEVPSPAHRLAALNPSNLYSKRGNFHDPPHADVRTEASGRPEAAPRLQLLKTPMPGLANQPLVRYGRCRWTIPPRSLKRIPYAPGMKRITAAVHKAGHPSPFVPVADFSGGFHDVVVDTWVDYFQRNGTPASRRRRYVWLGQTAR